MRFLNPSLQYASALRMPYVAHFPTHHNGGPSRAIQGFRTALRFLNPSLQYASAMRMPYVAHFPTHHNVVGTLQRRVASPQRGVMQPWHGYPNATRGDATLVRLPQRNAG